MELQRLAVAMIGALAEHSKSTDGCEGEFRADLLEVNSKLFAKHSTELPRPSQEGYWHKVTSLLEHVDETRGGDDQLRDLVGATVMYFSFEVSQPYLRALSQVQAC